MPLSFVLHTHMPYVEGHGTWPFGEEWLWEALATCYLPLADLLDEHPARVTLSLTPVLADQLEAPGVAERFAAFLREVRPQTHERDAVSAEAGGELAVAAELRRAGGRYADALASLERRGADLLGALAPHAAWTSSATHAVLPLLATDAGIGLQVEAGIAAHRARTPDGAHGWRGGFWLPECAWAPHLLPLLDRAGVRAVVVDLTDPLGRGAPEHLRPLRHADAVGGGRYPLLVPLDREVVELVWSDGGYPAHAAYRDSFRSTQHVHHPWANDGAVYDPERALAQARADAADFVARVTERIANGGLCVCALDTELLGHWWAEGVEWLRAVVEEADRVGLPILPLDDALDALGPDDVAAAPEDLPPTTWGNPRDLSTWSGPQVADLATALRRAELEVVTRDTPPSVEAVRALLGLQASDWAFLEHFALAGPYARERHDGHLAHLRRALDGVGSPAAARNLAVHASVAPLFA